jgi:hypothetical protein
MANTVIQLKHSLVTNRPAQLNIAEPAYSYSSNTLFIGTPDGLSSLNIGGLFYTTQIDDATDANTSSKIVKRDASGSFSATAVRASLFGNANTATALETARNFSIDGADVDSSTVSFDGTGAVVLQGNLKTTGVSSGNYGGATQIPTFTVDNKGRLSFAANVAISTSLQVAADTGANTIDLASDTLTLVGGDGITSSIDPANNVKFDVDNTVVRTSGNQSIVGDFAITGNLIVSGNTVTQDVENISTKDSLIKLAANNVGDVIDIGFYGQYNEDGIKYAGLIRDASDEGKIFRLFADETTDPSGNVVSYETVNRATLDANIIADTVEIRGFNVLDKTNSAFDLANTATNTAQAAFDLANGTSGVANTDVTNISIIGADHGSASVVAAFRVEANGRISSANSTSIAIVASQITSGTLGVARGGTGANTFTANSVILGQGTGAFSTVSSSTEGHVLTINNGGVPTFTMLSGGTF